MRSKRVNTYLVNIKILDDGVEARVEVIEQINHLQGRALSWQTREAHDVAEVDRHLIVCLRDHALSENQLGRYRSAREDRHVQLSSKKLDRLGLAWNN